MFAAGTRFDSCSKRKSIANLQYRLGSHKLPISIALGLIAIKSSEQKGEAMEDLSNNIAVVMNRISGQMEGLEISLQSLSDTDLDAHRGVIETLQGQDIILWQCLKVCTSAVDAAPLSTGYMVRRMEGFGSAKQLVTDTFGNAGPDPQGSYPLPWAMF
ncbi:hypothetical protein K458DRAFT_5114 [Lentithecium fluviatile CBS 122367]|uniref:Fungal N-terminal domain-containing protein n=1 Tax=Lentithecium fluviatile CBS 122367 TaxID=1168545 RepID=A0A6G1JNE8_9PLEO|nr:hypothetical protein K458DRAFT_5114 [Lentithecium fluviatile CBS 122367]